MSAGEPKAPRGWGADPVTSYFDNFRTNQYATFANKRDAVGDLIGIDGLFNKLMNGAINPRPFVPMGFFLRAHSAYRAAAGAVMAGQIYEAQALLRLCLEHGAYGFYIGEDNERWQRWMARNENAGAKEAVRTEFSHGKIKRHIKEISRTLGEHFETLYDQLIDFGAHPNERGFSLSSTIREVDSKTHFDTIYLHGEHMLLDYRLKSTAKVGLWVLHVAQIVYPARCEILGIRNELEKIRTRY